jgi:hypothetical protein
VCEPNSARLTFRHRSRYDRSHWRSSDDRPQCILAAVVQVRILGENIVIGRVRQPARRVGSVNAQHQRLRKMWRADVH